MSGRLLSLALIVCALESASASAEMIPGFDMKSLVKGAQLIVVGTLTDVADSGASNLGGNTRGRLVTGRIEVHQLLKGSVDREAVSFESPVWTGAVEAGQIAAKREVIGFLTHRSGRLEFVSPFYPVLQTVAGRQIRASDPLEAVAEAFTAVFQAPDAPTGLKRRVLRQLLTSALPSEATRAGLRPALKDPDRGIRLAAIGTLLANDDVEALPLAEAILLPPRPSNPDVPAAGLPDGLAGLTDPAALPALGRLLAGGDAPTRRVVVSAMGRIKSKDVLRLLGRALDDEDAEVRFNAVQSLADAMGDYRLRTNPQVFQRRGAEIIKGWKARLVESAVDFR